MKRVIATIGYEGAALGDFIATLRRASIDTVIDVRELPLSRKKGFSKRQLADHLRAHGIGYIHIKALGDPKPGRDAARAGNDQLFQKIFAAHMRTGLAREGLAQAATCVREGHACLMCFEADHAKCHRAIVAGHLSRLTGLAIMPLAVHEQTSTRDT